MRHVHRSPAAASLHHQQNFVDFFRRQWTRRECQDTAGSRNRRRTQLANNDRQVRKTHI